MGVDLSGYNSVASHFYDTSIHSTVFVDKDIVIYHTQLENDFKRFGPRKKLTDDYFNNITDLFSKNLNEYLGLVYELKDELPEVKMGHDVIIGHGDGLSELLQGFVDNNLASYEKMLEIKKQLVREYEFGQITDDTIEERFTVLLLDYVHEGMSFDDFENFLDSFDSDDEESETVKGFFDLAGDNKELKEDIFNAMLSHDEDKFEKAINNAIDDDDEFSKRFYDFIDEHEDLNSDARFDDFKNFLDSSDSNEDTEIVEDFFDLIGDNEELRDNLFSAVMSDDENKFEELIFNALNDDEDFSGRFFDFVEEYEDEDDFDDDYIDLNDLNLNFNSPFPIAEMMWGSGGDKYKLDDTFYGKDYPISHDNYVFRVLNYLKKVPILNIALAFTDMEGAMTQHVVEELLFSQNLISDEVNYDNWDEFANESLTVNDLKKILRNNNLKVSGRKQELIDRVAENHLPLDNFKSENVVITPEGEDFIKNNLWIDFYDNFLNRFDFNDFLKYLDNNEGDFIEICLDYVDEHLKLAKKENDGEYVSVCLSCRDLITEVGEKYIKNLEKNQ